jgi:signal transduction histidine kinase
VEAIRQRVAGISGRDLHARVPVPVAADEVAALAETMNAMLDRLENAAANQRRFVADAGHELRSPLATIRAGLDILAGNAAIPEGAARHVVRLQGETARIGRLVADLLLLARVDEHGLTLRHDDIDLDDLAYAERERLALEHPGLRVTLSVRPVRVTGDPDQLGRALRNLVDNAARYARTTVAIRVSTDALPTAEAPRSVVPVDPATAYIEVSDDGPGIPAADRARVFDRFARLDDSRSRTDGGTGLGLSIVSEIVTAHGGTVSIADTDAGTLLRVVLPIHPAQAVQ